MAIGDQSGPRVVHVDQLERPRDPEDDVRPAAQESRTCGVSPPRTRSTQQRRSRRAHLPAGRRSRRRLLRLSLRGHRARAGATTARAKHTNNIAND